MGRYIPQRSLENLKKYSYKGVDKSLVSQYFLNPFWNQLVKLWPTSVAPNTITLTGLLMVIANVMTLLYYDPTYLAHRGGATGPPDWIYLTWGIGLFVYQSLDAIDGKQARRTKMSGPLGEMFDHGCDAINTTLECILAGQALNLGRSWWVIASQAASLANFYLTTWEEYHTGQLFLGVFSGPVEGILLIVAIYVITYVKGNTFWDTGILTFLHLNDIKVIDNLIPDIGLNVAFMIFGAVGLAFNIVTSYANVYRACIKSGAAPFKPLLFLLPLPVTVGLQFAWLAAPTATQSTIMYSSPYFFLFMAAWGLQFAHQVGCMILAHVTKDDFPWWDSTWIWTVALVVDAHLPTLLNRPPLLQNSLSGVNLALCLNFAVCLFAYARFVTLVIQDITNFLGIACFTVRKRDASGNWVEATKVDNKKSL